MPAVLTEHAYGKSGIRLTRVTRLPDRHEVRELTVEVRLEGEFEASYTRGDNSRVIATDSMKNIVYALAHGRPAEPLEDFAAALAGHFTGEYPHVRSARVRIVERPWRRISVEGREHPHAFQGGDGETRTAAVTVTVTVTSGRDGRRAEVEAGLDGLHVLKTARSAFTGFVRDRYTTLPESTDRIFATEVHARWRYANGAGVDWDDAHRRVRRALLETFADHDSLSVQQTLHAMAEAALAAVAEVDEIALSLPNKHRILVDLERFGRSNVNEIFVATDEPFGWITGTVRRG
jgi:urate oxidase